MTKLAAFRLPEMPWAMAPGLKIAMMLAWRRYGGEKSGGGNEAGCCCAVKIGEPFSIRLYVTK